MLTMASDGTVTDARYRVALVREGETRYEARGVSTPGRAAAVAASVTADWPQEVFGAVMLDSGHNLIGHAICYVGALSRAVVEPRAVFQAALLTNAAAVILFHNHPSGETCPSQEDMAVTRRMRAAGETLGVEVLDHIIVGDRDWSSMRALGAF